MPSRMWKPQPVQILVEKEIAQHIKHAVNILNLSLLQDPSPQEALRWARVYRSYRNWGLPVRAAAGAANAYWVNQVSPMATIRLDVNDSKTIGSLMACYGYMRQLARKAGKEVAAEGAVPGRKAAQSVAYMSTQVGATQQGEHNDMQ